MINRTEEPSAESSTILNAKSAVGTEVNPQEVIVSLDAQKAVADAVPVKLTVPAFETMRHEGR